jgi:hypothetical protein
MPMTEKMRQSILAGQKAFKTGGMVTNGKTAPLIDKALMLVSRKT